MKSVKAINLIYILIAILFVWDDRFGFSIYKRFKSVPSLYFDHVLGRVLNTKHIMIQAN